VELNLGVAVAMADGPAIGLAMLDGISSSGSLRGYPYLDATRADLLRRLERWTEAMAAYEAALAGTANAAERRFLEERLVDVRRRAASVEAVGPS
jgi:RNA polymerase sigma-70 factor (ECF subfamily)